MKKALVLITILLMLISLTACGTDKAVTSNTDSSTNQIIEIKQSPDKYTHYVKNYVGKNCATLGYTSMGGNRLDEYGDGHLELVFISPDGTYVDISSEETLKEWVVIGQNLKPNTEIKLTFTKDSTGKEYENLVERQNYTEILLSVKRINENNPEPINLTTIKPSPDQYTLYIKDYVGRNLASCGYAAMSGDFLDKYGNSTIKFIIITDDGSYVDHSDNKELQKFVVTSQNISPNTKLILTFSKNSEGVEYSFVDSQNIKEIELHVAKITDNTNK